MTKFRDTDEAAAFLATADSRETSREIMDAIVFFARNRAEAEALWAGDGFGTVCHPSDIWERVTGNGRREPTDFCWGAAGANWWDQISVPAAPPPPANPTHDGDRPMINLRALRKIVSTDAGMESFLDALLRAGKWVYDKEAGVWVAPDADYQGPGKAYLVIQRGGNWTQRIVKGPDH